MSLKMHVCSNCVSIRSWHCKLTCILLSSRDSMTILAVFNVMRLPSTSAIDASKPAKRK